MTGDSLAVVVFNISPFSDALVFYLPLPVRHYHPVVAECCRTAALSTSDTSQAACCYQPSPAGIHRRPSSHFGFHSAFTANAFALSPISIHISVSTLLRQHHSRYPNRRLPTRHSSVDAAELENIAMPCLHFCAKRYHRDFCWLR